MKTIIFAGEEYVSIKDLARQLRESAKDMPAITGHVMTEIANTLEETQTEAPEKQETQQENRLATGGQTAKRINNRKCPKCKGILLKTKQPSIECQSCKQLAVWNSPAGSTRPQITTIVSTWSEYDQAKRLNQIEMVQSDGQDTNCRAKNE